MAKTIDSTPYQTLVESLKILEKHQSSSLEELGETKDPCDKEKLQRKIKERQKIIDGFKERVAQRKSEELGEE